MRLSPAILILVTLSFSTAAFAQGFPAAKRVDGLKSPHNRKRLRVNYDVLPDRSPIKLPDGSTEPRKAPWPMLLFITQNRDSKGFKKIQENVFADVSLAISTQALRIIKIKPARAIDLDFLAAVRGIQDPALIVLDRNYNVIGSLKTPKQFSTKALYKLLTKVVKLEYDTSLGDYAKRFMRLVMAEEKLHATEKKIEKIQEKASKTTGPKSEKLDKEADALAAKLAEQREVLEESFQMVRATLQLKGEAEEAIPTRIGKKGKSSRKLTPAETEAVKAYREFAKDQSPIVRAAAVEDLGALDSAVMVGVILKAANDIDPRVVAAAGKALGRMKKAESLEAMTEGLAHPNSKARRAALLGFATTKKPHVPAVEGILKLLASPDAQTRAAAIRALQNQKAPEGVAGLVAALNDDVPANRVLAAQALGAMKTPKAAAGLIGKLGASDWSLQKAAILALAEIRVKESIEPLLKKFETDEGLVIETVYNALVSITGQDYKYRATLWRRWWDRAKPGFKIPSDAEVIEAKAKAAKAMEGYATEKKRKYHRIETLSKKMIFILDISTSMRDKIVIPPSATDAERAEYPSRVKMDIAKNELLELVATLDKNVYFNIVTFAGRAKTWKKGLISGTAKNAAIKYIRRLKPIAPASGNSSGDDQKTNTYAAMMAAFGMADAKIPDWRARTKVDTIFLVTDGLPTTGKIVEMRKLVDAINEINRTRGIVIHVICFDKEALKRLKPLAEQSGGQAVLRGF